MGGGNDDSTSQNTGSKKKQTPKPLKVGFTISVGFSGANPAVERSYGGVLGDVGWFILVSGTAVALEVNDDRNEQAWNSTATTPSASVAPSAAPSDGEKLPNQGSVDGGVEGAPLVDAGKQGKHVPGHNNSDGARSQWLPGETGVVETQEAWLNGQDARGGTKVWDTGRVVGQNGETGVRVHIGQDGLIHGYPVNPGLY